MRHHFAIAHYYDANGDGKHGSLCKDPKPRINALREVILQLHRLFGQPSGSLNHHKRRIDVMTDERNRIDITICVTGKKHLLDEIRDLEDRGAFKRMYCEPETAKHLGFHCHKILEKNHMEYDYNSYLEDDIVIRDSDFFKKLGKFNNSFGDKYLLQPNRIETSLDLKNLRCFYIDGDYNPKATQMYRKSMDTVLCIEHLGEVIEIKQPVNTHSGCFFLNKNQSRMYFANSYWNNEDISFHGPLESAATLGVMKQFQIMKPSLKNGQFLTVEHAGRNFIEIIKTEKPDKK